MEKVLITGAAGFIGKNLVQEFKKEGFLVRATDLPTASFNELKDLDIEICPADLLDENSIPSLLKDIDIVIHTAGLFDYGAPYEKLKKINVQTVENISKACSHLLSLKKFVLFSSVAVYGKPSQVPCPEDSPKNPRNNYEITKWEGEKVAVKFQKEHGLPLIVVRPALVYGPYSKYGDVLYLCLFSSRAAQGYKTWPLLVREGPKSHRIHVEDLCRAVVFLVKREETVGNVYNIADESAVSFEEFNTAMLTAFGIICKRKIPYIPFIWHSVVWLLNKTLPQFLINRFNQWIKKRWQIRIKEFNLKEELSPRFDKDWLDYLSGDHYYDISKLKSLGFTFKYPKFSEGIKEVITWYKENKWLP